MITVVREREIQDVNLSYNQIYGGDGVDSMLKEMLDMLQLDYLVLTFNPIVNRADFLKELTDEQLQRLIWVPHNRLHNYESWVTVCGDTRKGIVDYVHGKYYATHLR